MGVSDQRNGELSRFKDCACCNLRRATRSVTQFFDSALEPAGLRVTQFAVLVVIAAARQTTINDLADVLALDRTTLTRNLKLLSRKKLIRISHGEDRRRRVITLTSEGRMKFDQAIPLWERTQQYFERTMGKNRFSRLNNTLLEMTNISA